jgi:hypothetical protein
MGTENTEKLFNQAAKDAANKVKGGISLDPLYKVPLRLEDENSQIEMFNIIANKDKINEGYKKQYSQQEDLKNKDISLALNSQIKQFTSSLGANVLNLSNQQLINDFTESGTLYIKSKIVGPGAEGITVDDAAKMYMENIIEKNFSVVKAGKRPFIAASKFDPEAIENWFDANLGSSRNIDNFINKAKIQVPPQIERERFKKIISEGNRLIVQSSGYSAQLGYVDLDGTTKYLLNDKGLPYEVHFEDMKKDPTALERERAYSDTIYDMLKSDLKPSTNKANFGTIGKE